MSWAHNTGFGNSETENEVISPQGNVVVSTACCAGFLGVDWAVRIYQRHHGLQPGEGVRPGIAEGRGAVLWQVFLPEEAEEAEDPGVFDRLREDPDVGRALHVVVAVDQDRVPLHQPLEVHIVGRR